MSTRRTKRRYAHELYPHPDEWEVRDLATDVPYLYARAQGLATLGTGWHDLFNLRTADGYRQANERTMAYISAAEIAFLADALHQGLVGQGAWAWAQERLAGGDSIGEWIYERATHYDVPLGRIKPYPCGPVPTHHDHMESTGDVMGHGIVTRIDVPEDECETCTEPIETGGDQ